MAMCAVEKDGATFLLSFDSTPGGLNIEPVAGILLGSLNCATESVFGIGPPAAAFYPNIPVLTGSFAGPPNKLLAGFASAFSLF